MYGMLGMRDTFVRRRANRNRVTLPKCQNTPKRAEEIFHLSNQIPGSNRQKKNCANQLIVSVKAYFAGKDYFHNTMLLDWMSDKEVCSPH